MAYGPTLATTLSTLVVEALVRIGLKQEDILSGPIVHDDLPWQIPPLVIEDTLFGVPFSNYLALEMSFPADALLLLWSEALEKMKNQPDKVLSPEGYRATTYALPQVRLCERQLHLSLPEGYPSGVSDFAGITLSLECAHLLQHNVRLKEFISDENNYFAVLPDGSEIGVKEGLPALYADVWDLPVEGMVQEMLRTPRGAVWEGCDYNIVSKVRSVTKALDPALRELDAVDWALQTLRVIDGHVELLAAVRSMPAISHTRKRRNGVLREAVNVSRQLSLTDRQRVATLKNILVPEVMTPAQFTKTIYPYAQVPPPMLAEKVMQRIQSAVATLLDEEDRLYKNQR